MYQSHRNDSKNDGTTVKNTGETFYVFLPKFKQVKMKLKMKKFKGYIHKPHM